MAILDDLGTLLGNAGVGTLGTSLFLGSLPADTPVSPQDEITTIIPIPSLPPVHSHLEAYATYTQPIFQILTRSAPFGFAAAMARAELAFRALDGVQNATIGGSHFLWILAVRSPYALRQDDYQRYHIVFDVRCAVR